MKRRLAVIGGGNMGGAFVRGWLAAKVLTPRQITVAEPVAARRRELAAATGVRVTSSAREAARGAGMILLAVKPQEVNGALAEIRDVMDGRAFLVSIAAGVTCARLERGLPPGVPVVRVMPNTPALLRAGMLAYCGGRRARPGHLALARRFLTPLGDVMRVPERWMDAVTALSGSGPAYVFLLAEALTEAGARIGLSRDVARRLAVQTIAGSGRMLKETGEEPSRLRARVTSPGGTTEAALRVLARRGFQGMFNEALARAARRAGELARSR